MGTTTTERKQHGIKRKKWYLKWAVREMTLSKEVPEPQGSLGWIAPHREEEQV